MKNLLTLALAVFSFAAVNADVTENEVDTITTEETVAVVNNEEDVQQQEGCTECGSKD